MWLRRHRFHKERAPTEATPTPLPATSVENGMVLGDVEGSGFGFGFGFGLDCVGSSLPPPPFFSPPLSPYLVRGGRALTHGPRLIALCSA